MSNNITECERDLVELARHDPEAFRMLYNFYLPRVYTYVSYRVGAQQDAEDLVSQIFLKVVEELARFEWRHAHSFAAWLFRIAHNIVVNFHRDASRAGAPLPQDALPAIAANALLPEDALLRKELFAQLHLMVNELPSRRREVLSLRYFAGLRNQEIAEVLGIAERTVASTLSRALSDLHTRLKIADASDNLK
jgi:RNA polymerase sigma-70 factor (ECF subfamily)